MSKRWSSWYTRNSSSNFFELSASKVEEKGVVCVFRFKAFVNCQLWKVLWNCRKWTVPLNCQMWPVSSMVILLVCASLVTTRLWLLKWLQRQWSALESSCCLWNGLCIGSDRLPLPKPWPQLPCQCVKWMNWLPKAFGKKRSQLYGVGKEGGDGGDGFFLTCKDFGIMFDNSFPACPFFLFYFFKVEISSSKLIPLFRPQTVHSGSASWDDCSWVFPDELLVSLFPDRFPHTAWTAA